MKCPSSHDGRHHRDNQDLCHYCGIPLSEGVEGAPVLTGNKAPLPLFFVTEKPLPKKRLAQLNEKSRPNVIHLSLPRLLAVGEDERRYVIFHELGHWFRHAYVPRELAGDEEDFAHAFGLYFANRSALKAESPPTWLLIDVLSKPHRNRIRRHAEKMLKALS